MVTSARPVPLAELAGITSSETPFDILRISGGLVIRLREDSETQSPARALTPRELQVLALVAEGCANKEVAEHLGISERTVKNHLNDIFTKLSASDRTHAVVTAVRMGIREFDLLGKPAFAADSGPNVDGRARPEPDKTVTFPATDLSEQNHDYCTVE